MPIREKFGLGYLTPAAEQSARDREIEPAPEPHSWAEQSVRAAIAMVGEKLLIALRARSTPAELSDLVSLTGYNFSDLAPAIRELERRGLITSQSGRFELTPLGTQTHTLK